VADEIYDALKRFHEEVLRPELDEIRSRLDGTATREELQAMRVATSEELQAMRAEMATRADLQAIRAEMATRADLQAMRAEMVTWPVLMRFHREVVSLELDEIRSTLDGMSTRSETLSYVDGEARALGRCDRTCTDAL
jgi:hypothetical protein